MNVTLQQQDDVDKNHHTSTGQEGLKSTQFEERLVTSWFDGVFFVDGLVHMYTCKDLQSDELKAQFKMEPM